ncbi:MAG: DEAD/DEAH box helicase [archaeon]
MKRYVNEEFIKKGKVEDREYQRNLVKSIVENRSTLVVAPTALGKTIVAALAIAERLKEEPDGKTVFLAPTKPLTEQHRKTLEEVMDLDSNKFTTLTGKIKPKERYKKWKEKQIITATPQTTRNDILKEKMPLEEVSLIIFDEAHRAVKEYAYVLVSDEYKMRRKEDKLVLALTASPGSKKSKIERVCKNLGIDNIEIKTEEDSDVEPYVQEKDFNWIKVDFPEDLKKIKKELQGYMAKLYSELREDGFINSYDVDRTRKKELLNLRRRLIQMDNKGHKTYKALSNVAGLMKVHHAIELIETQGVTPTLKYLEKIRGKKGKDKTKAGERMIKDPKIQKAIVNLHEMREKNKEHPKMSKTIEEIKGKIKDGKKILLFTQYRDTVQELVERLIEEEIEVQRFIGQTNKKNTDGMSQERQKETLEEFREKEAAVLVATQIAEEGLDIPSVDSVIFYEPIPSEIRHIQRKGRAGRRQKGEVTIMITKNTRDQAYYWVSKNREKKMKRMLKKWRDEKRNPKSKHDPKINKSQKTLNQYTGKGKSE